MTGAIQPRRDVFQLFETVTCPPPTLVAARAASAPRQPQQGLSVWLRRRRGGAQCRWWRGRWA